MMYLKCVGDNIVYDVLQYVVIIYAIIIIARVPIKRSSTGKGGTLFKWMAYMSTFSVALMFVFIDWKWIICALKPWGLDITWAPYGALFLDTGSSHNVSGLLCWFVVLAAGLVSLIYFINRKDMKYSGKEKEAIGVYPRSKYIIWSLLGTGGSLYHIVLWIIQT